MRRATDTRLGVVSLFSGAGGFDCGFYNAGGYRIDFANELNTAPATTFARNFFNSDPVQVASASMELLPTATQGDIAELKFTLLAKLLPDVLIGGPPCQDFSVMKGQNREGTSVQRGKLYLQFVHAIAKFEPRAFVFENVPGLVSANKNKAFKLIQSDLQNPGLALARMDPKDEFKHDVKISACPQYELIFSDIVDACNLGVPQTRRRLIIIGLRRDQAEEMGVFELASAKEWLDYRMNGGGTLFGQFPLTCMEVFQGSPLADLDSHYRDIMEEYRSLPSDMPGNPLAAKWVRQLDERFTLNARKDYLLTHGVRHHSLSLFAKDFDKAMEEHEAILNRLGYLGRPVNHLTPDDDTNKESREAESVIERMKRIPPGKNYKFVDGTAWEVEGKGLWLIYRRPFPLGPASTVVAYGGGGTYAYHYDRERSMLTNRERARLQTFADNFLFTGTRQEIRRQIGEAVPPLMATRVAEELQVILS